MTTPDDLTNFMVAYEKANNSHIFANVTPFIAPDAVYWFTDGSFTGLEEIRNAIEATFVKIQDKTYRIFDVHWIAKTDNSAACYYRFSWQGIVDGVPKTGCGRGTNVLEKRDNEWHIVHEHLSREPA